MQNKVDEKEAAGSEAEGVKNFSEKTVRSNTETKASKWEKAARKQLQNKVDEKNAKIDKWESYQGNAYKEKARIDE